MSIIVEAIAENCELSHQKDVKTFMETMGQPVPSYPTLENYPLEMRARLILEETLEFIEASGLKVSIDLFEGPGIKSTGNPPDWPEMIDAICDLLYVTYGAAVAMGVNVEPFWKAVHDSNMQKLAGKTREDGKRMKPEGWQPPDIKGILKSEVEKAGYMNLTTGKMVTDE